ncbi:conserved hypothetical protein [Candidatus Roizmanbacteria bacterium]|nr:conserved hypothetical protein [Candidatus Roizmanbacteria bacterium]
MVMEKTEYKNIFDNERTHFYYVGTHNAVITFLNLYLKKKRNNIILDAGCGTGLLMKKMNSFGKIYGIDASSEALKLAKKNNITKTKKASVEKIPFKDNCFDAIVSIDVLYHKEVKSDLAALMEFKRVLKPGGILIVKNPAHNWLRGSHDIIIHTKRRYSKKEFENKLNRAGLEIIKLSYINLFFLPLAILKRLTESLLKAKPESDVQSLPKSINRLLVNIYNLETKFLTKSEIPFGLSLFAVARKH